jgi:hypothetical protein
MKERKMLKSDTGITWDIEITKGIKNLKFNQT